MLADKCCKLEKQLRFYTERELESRQVQTETAASSNENIETSTQIIENGEKGAEEEEDEELCSIFMALKKLNNL